jgi:hypothetical protein
MLNLNVLYKDKLNFEDLIYMKKYENEPWVIEDFIENHNQWVVSYIFNNNLPMRIYSRGEELLLPFELIVDFGEIKNPIKIIKQFVVDQNDWLLGYLVKNEFWLTVCLSIDEEEKYKA